MIPFGVIGGDQKKEIEVSLEVAAPIDTSGDDGAADETINTNSHF